MPVEPHVQNPGKRAGTLRGFIEAYFENALAGESAGNVLQLVFAQMPGAGHIDTGDLKGLAVRCPLIPDPRKVTASGHEHDHHDPDQRGHQAGRFPPRSAAHRHPLDGRPWIS